MIFHAYSLRLDHLRKSWCRRSSIKYRICIAYQIGIDISRISAQIEWGTAIGYGHPGQTRHWNQARNTITGLLSPPCKIKRLWANCSISKIHMTRQIYGSYVGTTSTAAVVRWAQGFHLSSGHQWIVLILQLIISSTREETNNGGPLVSEILMEVKKPFLLYFTEWRFIDSGIQMVSPPCSTTRRCEGPPTSIRSRNLEMTNLNIYKKDIYSVNLEDKRLPLLPLIWVAMCFHLRGPYLLTSSSRSSSSSCDQCPFFNISLLFMLFAPVSPIEPSIALRLRPRSRALSFLWLLDWESIQRKVNYICTDA